MKYAHVVKILVTRDLVMRYKKSVLGVGWTLLNPLLTSFVLWIVFSFVFSGKLPDNQQYAPYLFAGIIVHNFFSQGVISVAESIAGNSAILTRIYVPPQVFALSTALAQFVHFLIGFLPLTLVVYISGSNLSKFMPLSIILGLLMVMLVSGLGLILSLVFVRFDDMRNIVNVTLLIAFYLTPVFYPISALSANLQRIINCNPLNSFLECFRWAFSNNSSASFLDWIYISSFSVFIFSLGIYIFKRYWLRIVVML
jgi:ABC-type polysaccharide/polyol phosphate export permease